MENICRQVVTLSAKLAPDPTTRLLLGCLTKMIAEQTESIDQKLDRMIGGYYKTGLNYLTDANSLDSARKQKWIESAIDQFIFASNIESTGFMQAKSKFFTAVCYSLLNEHNTALRWYEQAYETGYKQWQESLNKIQNYSNIGDFAGKSGGRTITTQAFRNGGIIGGLIAGSAALATLVIEIKKANHVIDQLTTFNNEFMAQLQKLLESWPSSLAIIRQQLLIPEKKAIF